MKCYHIYIHHTVLMSINVDGSNSKGQEWIYPILKQLEANKSDIINTSLIQYKAMLE